MTMEFLTRNADLRCAHELGRITVKASQHWVRIQDDPILVAGDPPGNPVRGCPNLGPSIKPCQTTLGVMGGYSSFIRIEGRAVCLDTLTGITDGTPPGHVQYRVRDSGQHLVRQR
ncbi:hypothetical protein [Ectothiorhodospira lacustris]|uniref:hypothetical protein n=1 Tax=Ectothiorhodospira lacustris TaxID=2899127 RepID=UPI001EE7C569|nr:hypothetical protein [Ectothiorhodospira lacustris]MCG5501137.1 hypothetical protein [Ectothiorhodospira lacustris]MCG5511221.1 hypothetical protein [Ectothiorhodospira lacustris]MCG5522963.1 hypothetical protein [Ectothiorhodospira lacustris]